MNNTYFELIGKMKRSVSIPSDEVAQFIENYVFFENTHITNDKYLKVVSNGKVEMFLFYNNSNLVITNGKNEITLTNFIVGIFELENALYIKPVTKSAYLSGIFITFNFRGVCQYFGLPVKAFTNKIVRLETIFGDRSKTLIDKITNASCNKQREKILNEFFLEELKTTI